MLTRYSLFIACFAWLEVSAQVDDEFRAMAVEPTTLNAVLRSSARHFPSVQAAQAAIAEREGNLLAAEGVFDPRVDGGLYSRLGGYYDGTAAAGYLPSACLPEELQMPRTCSSTSACRAGSL